MQYLEEISVSIGVLMLMAAAIAAPFILFR